MTVMLTDKNLKDLLCNEFLVEIDHWGQSEIDRARIAIKAYKSIDAFWRETRWNHDNLEVGAEEYLTKYRICRWYHGILYYFSASSWEDTRIDA